MANCENIPNRIIMKNNCNAHRKIIINKKFEWLNKYLSADSPKLMNPSTFVTTSSK